MTQKVPRRTGFFEHYEELIGTWTRRLRNRQQAQDLAHDTFVRVLESNPDAVEQPRAYLHQTARQLAESVERALQELPLNCRKVFVWQKIEGLTQAEIAERLGLSRNMVEKYMIRTLRHLRERVEAP